MTWFVFRVPVTYFHGNPRLKKLFNTESQHGLRAVPGNPLLLGCSLMSAITRHTFASQHPCELRIMTTKLRWWAMACLINRAAIVQSVNPRVSCYHVIRMFSFIIRSWLSQTHTIELRSFILIWGMTLGLAISFLIVLRLANIQRCGLGQEICPR